MSVQGDPIGVPGYYQLALQPDRLRLAKVPTAQPLENSDEVAAREINKMPAGRLIQSGPPGGGRQPLRLSSVHALKDSEGRQELDLRQIPRSGLLQLSIR